MGNKPKMPDPKGVEEDLSGRGHLIRAKHTGNGSATKPTTLPNALAPAARIDYP